MKISFGKSIKLENLEKNLFLIRHISLKFNFQDYTLTREKHNENNKSNKNKKYIEVLVRVKKKLRKSIEKKKCKTNKTCKNEKKNVKALT